MKIAVVYHSQSGNTKAMAEKIVAGILRVEGVEAKAFPIEDVDAAYVNESCCLIAGTPTYNGTMSAKMSAFLEQAPGAFDLKGKIGGAFATAAYTHGGAEIAVTGILHHMLFCGMMPYSSGNAFGHPVIHYGPTAIAGNLADFEELFEIYGERMANQAKKVFG